MLGVCEGMTWDEAKEFIIKKHDQEFWEKYWVTSVPWAEGIGDTPPPKKATGSGKLPIVISGWGDPPDYNSEDDYIEEEDEECGFAPVAEPADAEEKICTLGVCKGKTWDEAKEFIIRTNRDGEAYWKDWVKSVTWEVRQFEDVKESE
jgi:hypothetical protein